MLLTNTGNRLTSMLLSGILVPCYGVVSYGVKLDLVELGQSLVVIDVIFLVVGLPSIVSTRLGFQDRLEDGSTVWIVFFSVYALYAWKVVYGLKLKLWFLGGWLPFLSTQVCGVSLLELWFLLFKVLWFFAGISALYVFV
ncbi:hypothetical protein IGI04_030129 [Brassica rapa subsp. trilocularis]|uniref:Sodium/calcium exchanger membrane region domain-containing protein n=1 Tax=Brassica rapa subsp. trilocularis TaxID=1813537 RepID=A0ABQ7LSK4_BRACM|nr:hypothetical protein IGI04_030129 [Brassica rapa subsp. trilocularis]